MIELHLARKRSEFKEQAQRLGGCDCGMDGRREAAGTLQ